MIELIATALLAYIFCGLIVFKILEAVDLIGKQHIFNDPKKHPRLSENDVFLVCIVLWPVLVLTAIAGFMDRGR